MRERLHASLTIVAILSLFAIVIDASDNYTVNNGANLAVTAHTACRNVVNNSATGASVYVPTQTAAEWQSFYTSPPAGITAGSCSCTLPWGGTLNEGQSATAYQAASVPFGQTCASQTRTCTGGALSGTYQYQSCVVGTPASCTLPWGGSIAHGASVTAYQSATVSSGSCVSQNRSCSNGTLSGTYTNQSCSVNIAIPPGPNRNLCTIAGNPTTAGTYVFTLAAGGVVYSANTGTPALTTGTCWPTGSTITIVNNGTMYGMGGVGGNGGNGGSGADYPTVGTAGGNALSLSYAVSINNTNGFIYGGGGGGGGGARYIAKGVTRGGGGGGGGASGTTNSAGGTGGTSTCCGSGLNGAAGTTAGGGAGGTSVGGDGGTGGTFGAVGAVGANGSGSIVESGAAGGAAGKAIDMNGYGVTWLGGNNTTRVKGAVSN